MTSGKRPKISPKRRNNINKNFAIVGYQTQISKTGFKRKLDGTVALCLIAAYAK